MLTGRQNRRSGRSLSGLSAFVMTVAAAIVTVAMLLPLLWTGSVALKSDREVFSSSSALIPFVQFEPTLVNFDRLLEEGSLSRGLGNSLIVAGASTVVSVILGSLAGYGLAESHHRVNRSMLMLWLLSQRFVPPILLAIPSFILMRQLELINTRIGLILLHISLTLPFAVLIMRDHYARLSRSVVEASRIDGANLFQRFRYIAMPSSRGAAVAAAVVCFIFSWNDFTLALVFTNDRDLMTAPVILVQLTQAFISNIGMIAAASLVVIALPILLSLVVRRYVFDGVSLGITGES